MVLLLHPLSHLLLPFLDHLDKDRLEGGLTDGVVEDVGGVCGAAGVERVKEGGEAADVREAERDLRGSRRVRNRDVRDVCSTRECSR